MEYSNELRSLTPWTNKDRISWWDFHPFLIKDTPTGSRGVTDWTGVNAVGHALNPYYTSAVDAHFVIKEDYKSGSQWSMDGLFIWRGWTWSSHTQPQDGHMQFPDPPDGLHSLH